MKKIAVIILFGLFLGFNVQAHGGVSNQAGEYILFLNQLPVSPLVGEKVELNFGLKNTNFESKANIPIEVKVIEIQDNDPQNDKWIETLKFNSDVNGSFAFDYTFPKESYYDIEVGISEEGKAPVTIGFLVQTREKPLNKNFFYGLVAVDILAVGALLFHRSRIK